MLDPTDGEPQELRPQEPAGPVEIPAGTRFVPDRGLLDHGWEYRFVAGGPRLKETVALYTELGFEVREERIPSEAFAEECEGCKVPALMQFRMVYTRKRAPTLGEPRSAGSGLDR